MYLKNEFMNWAYFLYVDSDVMIFSYTDILLFDLPYSWNFGSSLHLYFFFLIFIFPNKKNFLETKSTIFLSYVF